MANLFIEGWENYPTGGLNTASGSPWIGGANYPSISGSSTSITGDRSLYISSLSASDYAYRTFGAQTEVYFGFAVIFGVPNAAGLGSGVGVASSPGSSSLRLTVWVNGSGQWVVHRGDSLLDTNTDIQITPSTKYYVEGRVTSTSYEILVDGNVVLSGSMTSIGTPNYAYIKKGTNCTQGWVDDCYWNNTDGSANNGYLGEISVLPLFPDTDESPQDWTLSSGSDAYSLIGVTSPDDLNYISAQSADDEAAFTFEEIPFPVTDIFAVQTTYRAQKESSGESAVQLSLTQGSTTDAGAENYTAEETYVYYYDSWEKDPDTNDAWSPDTFDPKVTLKRTV